ncbi:MAG: GNAT family N-acetyltransferase [Thermoleophilia bacterium]|nr:GNAT family N-acetyltransferase [Thermoleophilia bacterium]
MSVEIRVPSEEERRAAIRVAETAFADTIEDADVEREERMMPLERVLVAFDDGRPVGLAAAYRFELSIPGGPVPCAGVTWVAVLPTHRRRGILRQLMARQLNDVHESGEPIAALWASEAAIYGRFGYGISAPTLRIESDSSRFSLREDPWPPPEASWTLLDGEEAFVRFPPIYERVRSQRAGLLGRDEGWWREYRLADPERWRHGASRKSYALLQLDGEDAAYAVYRVKSEWERDLPVGEVRVTEAFATTPAAERELWRYLSGVDLTVKVSYFSADPAASIFLMVRDPRGLRPIVHDGLWLRLVDVEAALAARTYRPGDPVVLEVRDDLCPWNAGRFRVGEGAERTDAEPDLILDVADLASVYLGAYDFVRLARARRVDVRTASAAERASDLVRTPLPPWCPEIF